MRLLDAKQFRRRDLPTTVLQQRVNAVPVDLGEQPLGLDDEVERRDEPVFPLDARE